MRKVSRLCVIVTQLVLVFICGVLGGCSKYKSSWTCSDPKGIGCSSVRYADQVARKHIILNDDEKQSYLGDKKRLYSNKMLIKEHYSDFKKFETQEVEID